MKREIAEQWAAALKSGEYEQTVGYLRAKDLFNDAVGYCCLGVLCDLYAKATNTAGFDVTGEKRRDGTCLSFGYDGDHFEVSSEDVREWSGLQSAAGELPVDEETGEADTLASLNDDGRDFNTIADIILQNIDVL